MGAAGLAAGSGQQLETVRSSSLASTAPGYVPATIHTKGAAEIVLQLCSHVAMPDGSRQLLTDVVR